MRKALIVGVLAALAVPVVAFAATPSPNSLANETCKSLRTSMGANFALTYGTNASRSNAFGQCVRKHTAAATQPGGLCVGSCPRSSRPSVDPIGIYCRPPERTH